MRAATFLCLAGCLLLAGCVNRDRLNDRCEWRDAGFPVDRNNRDHQRHLIEDVHAAEELGIRFGDAVRATQGIDASLRERERCTSALFAEIAQLHAIVGSTVPRAESCAAVPRVLPSIVSKVTSPGPTTRNARSRSF